MFDAGQHKIFSSEKAYDTNKFSTLKYGKIEEENIYILMAKNLWSRKIWINLLIDLKDWEILAGIYWFLKQTINFQH